MIAAGSGAIANAVAGELTNLRVADEGQVLWPADIDEDLQAHVLSEVHEPARRDVIDPQAIGAQIAHLLEIAPHLLARGKRKAVTVRGKRPVGNALHIELLSSKAKELPVTPNTVGDFLIYPLAAMRGGMGCGSVPGS